MTHELKKLSAPDSWTKLFSTLEEARKELLSHICGTCLRGDEGYWGLGAPNTENIEELLATGCGCEYDYRELDEEIN